VPSIYFLEEDMFTVRNAEEFYIKTTKGINSSNITCSKIICLTLYTSAPLGSENTTAL